MALVTRYDRVNPYTLRDTFNTVFSNMQRWNGANLASTPPANLYETDTALNVVVSLPGVDPNEVEVTVEGKVLSIKGERRLPMPEQAAPLWRGIPEGAFHYSFNLPAQVDFAAVEAHYEHGLLLLNVPKRESAKPQRIPVRTGAIATGATPAADETNG